jgi:molybdopterin-containing oxidoreductase family iron-sulfur binding subunit
VGADIFPLWPGTSAFGPVVVERTGRTEALAVTQDHWSLEGRDVARSMTAMEASLLPERDDAEPESIYRNQPAPHLDASTNQWAMTIDLSRCTGCSACVIACQAENNVPSVGREGVLAHREMHWLRIDQYRDENAAPPARIAQPMLCQHCEKAPCEYVCPVAATTHSPDGLNEMTYNRCVGTRFCSNNCPYKVRRYNWFDYNDALDPVEMMAKNPHVTVRERGVMEKCTFCVQRIREAEINAAVAERPLGATEVRTACQQSCPTEAIQFGSLTEPGSPVVALRARRRAFDVLDELGTRPRVRYLARVRTPNANIPEAE